jgi:uncharacterized membrane protein (DUF106 family)
MHSVLLEVVSCMVFVTVLQVNIRTLQDLAAGTEQMHGIVMLYVLCQSVVCDYITKCLNLIVICFLKL